MRACAPVAISLILLAAGTTAFGATADIGIRQSAKLTASDAAGGDEFGTAVALDGERLLVGALFDDDLGPGSGSAYIFERSLSAGWVEVAKLTAPDGRSEDWSGGSVALSGDTALVAASVNDISRPGYAYIFERDAGGPGAWGPVAKLVAADGAPGDGFGCLGEIEGDTAVVTADSADGPGGTDDGAVYVYDRDAGGADAWGQIGKLRMAKVCDPPSPDRTHCGWDGDSRLGGSVDLSSDTLLVGNSELSGGYAYVFQRVGEGPGSAWRRVARLAASDEDQNGFKTVAVSGETVVVGASGDDDLGGGNSGAAYLFEPDPGGAKPWREVLKIYPHEGTTGDYSRLYFGARVEVDGDTLVVGASQIDGGGAGKAYVYRRHVGGPDAWGAVATLVPAEIEPHDAFGRAVGVRGATIAVGAYGDDDRGSSAGAVYVYEATWVEPAGGSSGAFRMRDTLAHAADAGVEHDEILDRSLPKHGSLRARPDMDLGGEPRAKSQESEQEAELAAALKGASAESFWWAAIENSEPLAMSSGNRAAQQAQLCFDFTQFQHGDSCDGLELTLSAGILTGLWRNTDCEGTNVPVSGTIEGGQARVVCDATKDTCPAGFTWSWILDGPLDGTMDMFQLDGLWNSWIDELPYIATTGPCPFGPRRHGSAPGGSPPQAHGHGSSGK